MPGIVDRARVATVLQGLGFGHSRAAGVFRVVVVATGFCLLQERRADYFALAGCPAFMLALRSYQKTSRAGPAGGLRYE